MGYDAACTLHLDGQTARGTALLEQGVLRFRGPIRLVIPLEEISSATARDGSLAVRFGSRVAELELGAAAAKWAERITHPRSRMDKLGLKPGTTVALVGLSDPAFRAEMKERGVQIMPHALGTRVDAVFFGAEHRDVLRGFERLKDSIVPNGAIWVVRPKGQQCITEADVMASGRSAALVDVKVVNFSPTHTAEKFVIPVAKRGRVKVAGQPSGSGMRRANTDRL